MGVCLLIYQYIHFELSYDQFHPNAKNIYRLTQFTIRNNAELGTSTGTGRALGVRGKENIPQINQFVRIHPQFGDAVVSIPENNEVFKEDKILFVDDNFLEMFDFPLKSGARGSALDEKYNIVITQEIATKYFGDKNPLGKQLKVSSLGVEGDFKVAGVVQSLPTNSHLQFDFLLPNQILLENDVYQGVEGMWGWTNFVTYVTIDEVGVRKSIGAAKYQLISQFMVEFGLINLASAILSIGIAFCLLPILNTIIENELELSVLQDAEFWVWSAIIVIFGSVLSGLYPAFVLSSFKPIRVFNSTKNMPNGGINLRKGLITFQQTVPD